jgi:hypothetical protein
MINISIQPVPQTSLITVNYLAINVVNLSAPDLDQSYGQAQYTVSDQNENIVLGTTCSFSREESDNWVTDEDFAKWLTINKLGYTPI